MNSPHASLRNNLPRKAIVTALICELVLVGIYWFDIATGGYFHFLHSLFDLDSEGNVPAWFSSSQLFCVALTFWSCAFRKKSAKLFFVLAGVAALYVSSDETAQIHERVTALMGQRYVDWLPEYAAQNFWLVMLTVALLLTVCQFLADDLLSLWHNNRRVLLLGTLGIAIGLTGGMGVETIGYKWLQGNTDSIFYNVEVSIEEFMEMSGASVVLYSVLKLRLQRGKSKTEATRGLKSEAALKPA
jgi:hypothetical protein